MNPNMNALIRELRKMANNTRFSAAVREKASTLLRLAENAQEDYEELLVQAKRIGARNPEFDGDEVGRPDDDF